MSGCSKCFHWKHLLHQPNFVSSALSATAVGVTTNSSDAVGVETTREEEWGKGQLVLPVICVICELSVYCNQYADHELIVMYSFHSNVRSNWKRGGVNPLGISVTTTVIISAASGQQIDPSVH